MIFRETKRKTRAQLRGKPLDEDCKRYGRSDPYQFGIMDRRCFCTGIMDKMTDDYMPKCRQCAALNILAQPPSPADLADREVGV